jgi:hypothetical protein
MSIWSRFISWLKLLGFVPFMSTFWRSLRATQLVFVAILVKAINAWMCHVFHIRKSEIKAYLS